MLKKNISEIKRNSVMEIKCTGLLWDVVLQRPNVWYLNKGKVLIKYS